MKTQISTNPSLPSPIKFSLYILAVAVVCLLNWSALNAADNQKADTQEQEARLEAALVPVAEEEVELMDWMLTFSSDQPETCETEDLFAGILTIPEEEYFDAELEMVLQAYRLDCLASNLEETSETEPAIEDWMVNSESWTDIEFLATK